MARICTVCALEARDSVDRALVSGLPMRRIAAEHGVSETAVRRHRDRHLSPALAAVQAQREADRGVALLDRIEDLVARTERILDAAEASGRVSIALSAIREQRELLRLLGAASGELRETPTVAVNLIGSAEWQRVRGAIVSALASYPAARAAVAAALMALDQDGATPTRLALPAASEARYNAEGEA